MISVISVISVLLISSLPQTPIADPYTQLKTNLNDTSWRGGSPRRGQDRRLAKKRYCGSPTGTQRPCCSISRPDTPGPSLVHAYLPMRSRHSGRSHSRHASNPRTIPKHFLAYRIAQTRLAASARWDESCRRSFRNTRPLRQDHPHKRHQSWRGTHTPTRLPSAGDTRRPSFATTCDRILSRHSRRCTPANHRLRNRTDYRLSPRATAPASLHIFRCKNSAQ